MESMLLHCDNSLEELVWHNHNHNIIIIINLGKAIIYMVKYGLESALNFQAAHAPPFFIQKLDHSSN